MTTQTKQQFMARPKIAQLPRAAKNAAWKNYLASKGGYKRSQKTSRSRRQKNKPQGGGSVINPLGAAQRRDRDQIGGVGAGSARRNTRKPETQYTSRTVRSANAARGQEMVKLSSCGTAYITSLLNPFGLLDATSASSNRILTGSGDIPRTLPCVPTFPALKSRRLKVFIRGTFQTDVNGGAQIVYAPRRGAQWIGVGASNTTYTLFTTDGTVPFGLTFMPLDTNAAIGAGIAAYNYNSDYVSAQLPSSVSERLVCAGVRIRYAGAEMNQAGIVHGIEEPNHNSLNALPLSTFNQYESYFSQEVEKKWMTLVYTPVGPDDYVYDIDYVNGYVVRRDSHYMGMMVVGCTGNSTFQFECVAVIEMIGSAIRDQIQATSDMKAVEVAANNVTPNNQQMMNGSDKGLENVMKNVMTSGNDFTKVGNNAEPHKGPSGGMGVSDVVKLAELIL